MRPLYFLIFLSWLSPAFASGWQPLEAVTNAVVQVRGAPGPYEPVAEIGARTNVIVGACYHEGDWCAVSRGDVSGYADGNLLTFGKQTVKQKYVAFWRPLLAANAPRGTQLAVYGDSTAIGSGGTPGNFWYDVLARTHPFTEVFNAGIGGQTMKDMATGYLADPDPEHRKWLTIFYDRWNGGGTAKDYVDQLQRAVDAIETDRFLILPQVMYAPVSAETETQKVFGEIDVEVRKRWPDNTFTVPQTSSFVQALSNPDTRSDSLHRNNRGQAIEARYIGDWLRSKGW